AKERNQLSVYAAMLKEADLDRIVASTHYSLNEDQNFYGTSQSLQERVPPVLEHLATTSQAFIDAVTGVAEAQAAPTLKPDELVVLGARARQASFELWRVATDELDVLLQKRIDRFTAKRTKSLFLSALAFLAAVSLVTVITRSISGPLQKQAA